MLRSATDDEVRELFSRFGRVHEVNLFRAFQGAPTTKVRAAIQRGVYCLFVLLSFGRAYCHFPMGV